MADEPPVDETLRGDDEVPDSGASGEQLASQLAAERDRVLRLQAELQNQINRHARLMAEERRYAALPLMSDLLPVLDNVDRAIAAAEKESEGGPLLEGFRMVRQLLIGALEKHGLEKIDDEGRPFDPDQHQAILQQPSAEVEAGHVLQSAQTGYMLHDRVVRASQVIVSSGPPEA